MKAAVTVAWNRIAIENLPVPKPAPGEALVRVRYAGICGSDVHIYLGHHPTAKAPVVQGHEFVGTLEQVGPDTTVGAKVGDRVVVEPLISCGRCEACRVGHWHVCGNLGLLGIHRNGAFAEYVAVDAAKVIAVPEGLSDPIAALTEPFAVGYHVCRRAELRNGERALVIGAGPIGLIVAMVAQVSGARVTLCEINPQRLAQAKQFGFNVIDGTKDPVAAAGQVTDGDNFDVVFEVSGSQPGILLATEVCRIRGRLVHVGFPPKDCQLNVLRVIFKELTTIGSRVYTLEDFRGTVAMLDRIVRDKRFDVAALITEVGPLESLEAGIGKMTRGECKGKILVAFE